MRTWLVAQLRKERTPFAILSAHDLLGITVLDACQEAGLDIPREAAVLGIDNEQIICECAPVPLSSVDNNLFEHGYQAARLLDTIIQGAKPSVSPVLIPPRRVVTRASTDTIAASEPQLSHILQYIHEHLEDPSVMVKELCGKFVISRRTLDALFTEAKLGPPGQVIHEARLRRACAELTYGSKTVNEVAVHCGFASARNFCRYFRKMKGTSPRAWRERTQIVHRVSHCVH
jgi:LacI family transcriptional regulator